MDSFVSGRVWACCFQSGALFTDMTVFDNVAFPLRIHTSLTASMIRDIVLMKLQDCRFARGGRTHAR